MADDKGAAFRRIAVITLQNGRRVELGKLGLNDWTSIQEAALDEWKTRKLRQREDALVRAMETGRLVEMRRQELREVEERVERLEPDDLPRKRTAVPVMDPEHRGKISEGPAWECRGCEVRWGVPAETPAERVECPACFTREHVAQVSGEMLPAVEVREVDYAIWWISHTAGGRVFATWLSMRKMDPTLTLDHADQLWTEAGADELENAANKVGEISRPRLGNPDGSE